MTPTFPGWPAIALVLPFFGCVAAFFLGVTAPHRESEWFPREAVIGLRALHIAAILGVACAVIGLVRRERQGLLSPFSMVVYFVVSLAVLVINLAVALLLIPVWSNR